MPVRLRTFARHLRFAVFAFLACPAALSFGADAPTKAQASARLNNLGVAYMNQQLTEKALHQFEEAYKADSSAAVPLTNQGIAYLYLRKLPEAEETLKKATAADPESTRAWYSLGLAHFSAGDQETALADFRHALTLDPRDADVHYFVATILLSLKRYDEAVTEFKAALERAPLHASAHFGLARALQREGKLDESKEHLKRFQEITQSKIGTLMSASYGEQGHYATVADMMAAPRAPGAMIPVHFEVAASGRDNPAAPSERGGPAAKGGLVGGGACLIDLEGNGDRDVLVMRAGTGLELYRASKEGKLEPLAAERFGLALKGDGVSCAVGDYDNDNRPDLAVALADRVVVFHNTGGGHFVDTTAALGITAQNRPAGLTFVDFDHDGDLDLLVTGAPGPGKTPDVLWRNNGNATFTEWTGPSGLGGTGATLGAVLSDLNNDRAVDLVVADAEGAPQIFFNQREGAFRRAALYADKSIAPARALAIADLNKDGWMDVIVTHAGAPGITVWKNNAGTGFERIPLELDGITGAWGVTPVDVDNDGWIDLAVVVETAKGTELRVLRNLGPAGFSDVSAALKLGSLELGGARSVLAADVERQGAADLLVTRVGAGPELLRNVGGSKHRVLRVDLTGLADNKSAIGTKVEVFSEGDWQKFEVTGASGFMSQGSTEILAGIGESERADIIRLLWPTGVPQDELDVASNKPAALTELDRRGSSCPVLFAWDGTKYRFVSDVIGAAVVGHWTSPTEHNRSDTDEWTKIDGDLLREHNGMMSVRFGEPMEEINYIDQLRLLAVDHPAGTEAYPDERFMNEPPFASGRPVLASSESRLPAGAWDSNGRDVLALLSKRDHQFVRDFTNLPYAGFADPHTLILDLGGWSPEHPLRLFFTGYIEYFSASSMYAAWQAHIAPQSPVVEAQRPDGSWKEVVAEMGFPAGLERTIVVDLSGKLPPGTRRIRLRTNLQIYWDQVLIDNAPGKDAGLRVTELPLRSAHLAFRGYPKQIEGATPGDITYDYQSISATGPFLWQRGNYTRYGDVTSLLTSRDNRHAIFGSGEDIDAEFGVSSLPPLAAGWKRDYFFYADGFVKDMDFYEAMPFTVAELPFHGMTSYPYPEREHFPDTPAAIHYRLDWNTRMETGDRTQRFQFHYEPSRSAPIPPEPEQSPDPR